MANIFGKINFLPALGKINQNNTRHSVVDITDISTIHIAFS